MCGSTNTARNAAFLSAATFYSAQNALYLDSAASEGQTRQHIAHVKAMGADGEPPLSVLALADAEDAVLALLREVQLAQQAIILAVLNPHGGTVYHDDRDVETLVASLNNLEVALKAADAALATQNEEAQANADEIASILARLGEGTPVLQ